MKAKKQPLDALVAKTLGKLGFVMTKKIEERESKDSPNYAAGLRYEHKEEKGTILVTRYHSRKGVAYELSYIGDCKPDMDKLVSAMKEYGGKAA